MKRSPFTRLLLIGVGVVTALGAFVVARPDSEQAAPPTTPPRTEDPDRQASDYLADHDALPLVEDVTVTTIVLDDGSQVEVVDEFILPDGSVVDGEDSDVTDSGSVASDAGDAGDRPEAPREEPVPTLPESPNRDRIESIKRDVNWPAKPDLGANARYAQEYWEIVDVPEDEVLIVSLVHNWLFTPGDAQTGAVIASMLSGQGWPGLPETFDPERWAYKMQSNSLPGCGVLGEVVCMVRVYVDSGWVEVVQTYYA